MNELVKSDVESLEDFDISADSDEYIENERIAQFKSNLEGVEKLWRLGINDEKYSPIIAGTQQPNYFWLRWFERVKSGEKTLEREESVSLMYLLQRFIELNSHIPNNHDLFFAFMFQEIKPQKHNIEAHKQEIIASKSLALLIEKLIASIESDPDRYLDKIEEIKISKSQSKNPTRQFCVTHWDLKYGDQSYCEDKEILELLIRNTEFNSQTIDQEKYAEEILSLQINRAEERQVLTLGM